MPLPTISPRRHPSNSPRRALPGSSPTAATASLTAGLLALLALVLPSPLLADEGFGPDWVEDGDAGNSISTGQRVKGNNSGVNTISGSTSGGGGFVGGSDGGDFQDLYLIFIDDPLAFNASTAGPAGDATFNTRLFLFRIDGRGVLYSDDVSPNDNRSVLKGGKGIPGRGVYGLAIAGTPSLPQTTGGSPMFPFAPPGESVGPTKEGANASLGGWNPAAGDTGSYLLSLTGVRFIPEPCEGWRGLIEASWAEAPERRPSFDALAEVLEKGVGRARERREARRIAAAAERKRLAAEKENEETSPSATS